MPDLKSIDKRGAPQFSFFQLLRLLEHMSRLEDGDDAGGFGDSRNTASEPAKLKAAVGSHFAETEVQKITVDASGRSEIFVQMFGLTGPSGVLPAHYTDYVQHRLRRRDEALAAFLDLFHQRSLSLFYRAWKKYRVDVSLESRKATGQDPFGIVVASLSGLYPKSLQDRLELKSVSLLGYAGYMTRRINGEGLAAMISDAISSPTRIRPFKGRWSRIADDEQTRLSAGGGSWNILGRSAVIGSACWDVQHQFAIEIGPVTEKIFADLLPGGDLHKRLVEVTKLAIGPDLDFEIEVLLDHDRTEAIRLRHDGKGPRLGYSTWLPEEFSRSRFRRIPLPSA
ncbi:MAG: type VI secretion system baseplate subunit TssG [Pseudomonadota bacterium]